MRLNKNNDIQWYTVKAAFSVLSKKDKKKIAVITFIQIMLGFVDLLGIFLIGMIVVLSASGIKSQPPDSTITKIIDYFGLSEFSFQTQVAILSFYAAMLLIGRTLSSMYFTRKILFYLSRRAAAISSDLVYKLLSQDLLTIQRRSSQETLYALTTGVSSLMLGVIGTVLNLVADLFLLLILSAGLFSINVLMALITFLLFASVSLVLYSSVQKRIIHLSKSSVDVLVYSNEKILEALSSYRDLYVRNRRSFYSSEISNTRLALANNSAELSFIPNLGKYVIEITLVFGAIFLSAIQFLLQDATQAIVTLSIFLAAASRIAPAVLRVQSGLLAIKSSYGAVSRTIDLMEDLSSNEILSQIIPLDLIHEGFESKICLKNISFTYPESVINTIEDVNFDILPGEIIAFVGPSGAGKSTLVDLALGILKPDQGEVTISGVSPLEAINKWPGAIAYVPQDVQIINGSIKNNVAMGFPESEQIDSLVIEALKISQLDNFLLEHNSDLNLSIGERGSKLSGGQRQRLGIARALYLKPKLIVLDEATSSLDGQTESDISDAIFSLRGKVTLLLIAHRLSTVKHADKIIYIEKGKILAIGKFEEVRRKIPNFDIQASLMGI